MLYCVVKGVGTAMLSVSTTASSAAKSNEAAVVREVPLYFQLQINMRIAACLIRSRRTSEINPQHFGSVAQGSVLV